MARVWPGGCSFTSDRCAVLGYAQPIGEEAFEAIYGSFREGSWSEAGYILLYCARDPGPPPVEARAPPAGADKARRKSQTPAQPQPQGPPQVQLEMPGDAKASDKEPEQIENVQARQAGTDT